VGARTLFLVESRREAANENPAQARKTRRLSGATPQFTGPPTLPCSLDPVLPVKVVSHQNREMCECRDGAVETRRHRVP
jgi:hypothetical protein